MGGTILSAVVYTGGKRPVTMRKTHFLLSMFIFSALLTGCASDVENNLEDYRMPTDVPGSASLAETAAAQATASTPPENCPVTVPPDPPFVPPAPYSGLGAEGYFWYGSHSLWVALPRDGVWTDLTHDSHGYSRKMPWWREGYVWDEEPEPPLVVTGERLDSEAPPLAASSANGAYAPVAGSAMVMGADFPSLGCWRITGNYRDAELSFVVWLAP